MEFYTTLGSAPCRSVDLLAKSLKLTLNKHQLNLREGDHLKPEYLKINPQHTVPTLVDNGLTLYESSAILIYLAEKYDKTNSLYSNAPEKRGLINQRLYFANGVLYQRFGDYFYPQLMRDEPADPEKFKKLEEAVGFLNTFLEGQKFAVGDSLTIADFPLVASVSTLEMAKFDLSKYSNVVSWYENVKKVIPGWSESYEELVIVQKIIADLKKK